MKTVLITGASSGLGLALARKLSAAGGFRLLLSARASSMQRFDALGLREGEHTHLRCLDVNNPEQAKSVVAEAEARFGGVDVLVNNAGLAYRSVVEHVSDEERWAQMDVNFRAPMRLARLVLPGMRARRRGHIINVSSVGGMMAMPTMSVYSASKFALEGASEALWYEVRPWGIHVSLVRPGFIRSNSFMNTRHTVASSISESHPDEAYHAHYEHMGPFIAKMMRLSRATPDHVAEKIVKLMRRRNPPLRVLATPDARLFYLLRRALPRPLYHRLLYACLPQVRRWGPGARALPKSRRREITAPLPLLKP